MDQDQTEYLCKCQTLYIVRTTNIMGWKYICCGSLSATDTHRIYDVYNSAGLHFIDHTNIIMGEQPRKTIPCMSGLGGKREDTDVSCIHTAYRETLEELCGACLSWVEIDRLICDLILIPEFSYYDDGYVFYVLTQKDMLRIIDYVWTHYRSRVELYGILPRNIGSVASLRKYVSNTEVCRLYNANIENLLDPPKTGNVGAYPLPIDPFFLNDLKKIVWWIDSQKKLKR